jgi:hypothetical protein
LGVLWQAILSRLIDPAHKFWRESWSTFSWLN